MRSTERTPGIGLLGLPIILATVFTAAVHVYLAVSPTSPEPQLRRMFLLAAAGFLGTLAALYAPFRFLEPLRGLARLGLLGVTVATIVAYVVVVGLVFDTLAIVDKSVEGFLVVALVLDGVRTARARGLSGRPGQRHQETGGRLVA